ncbi:energy transducer TonB [Paraburkholderia dipogonis]|uniref:Protein TonB n=2 Tax=Paraburkholderia dipogonis TaxID=1211383 RepID=A0A4Y8N511_9BURK|nr:energy transducer TonB [Paraburkholderia dipogonis]TFE44785.1 energy transducer TonB [Paraburkholderia dipogonis]
MPASPTVSASAMPASPTRTNSRVLTATAVVAAIHVALLAVVMTLRHDPVQPVLESRVMTAQLLPPAPVAAPVAIQSIAPPPPTPTPPVRTKPKVQPKPTPTPKPAPTPLPVAAAPSPTPVAAPDPTPPAPAAPVAPPAPAAPAIGRQTMEISAPKDMSHLSCNVGQPDYPPLSRRRGETGTVIVSLVVSVTGKIENVALKKSSGFSRLDDAALDAVRSSACKPYLENGQPVRVPTNQPFVFNLND